MMCHMLCEQDRLDIPGRGLSAPGSMLSPHNTTRCGASTRRPRRRSCGPALAGLLVACLWSRASHADDDFEEVPAADAVRAAHATLRQWVSAFAAPQPDEPAARIAIPGGEAVCVTLRHNGRIVGVSADASGDELMVRRAAGRAMSAALGDDVIASVTKLNGQLVGAKLTVELEAAGAFVPLPGASMADYALRIEPGLDGLAVRREGTTALRFPSQLRTAGLADSPQKVLPALATDTGLPPSALNDLTRHRAGVYRFRVRHLAQQRPEQIPFESFRGDVLVHRDSVTRQSIVGLAEGLVKHLMTTRWPDAPAVPGLEEMPPRKPLGLMGTYRPIADRYGPLVAPPLEQALAALALAEFAASPAADAALRKDAGGLAAEILSDLAMIDGIEKEWSDDLQTVAAYALAVVALPEESADGLIRARMSAAVAALLPPDDPSTGSPRPLDVTAVSPHGRALIASAQSRLRSLSLGPLDETTFREFLGSIWTSVPEHERVMLLPWIGWAEHEFAALSGRSMIHADELAALRNLLHDSQVDDETNPGAADLQGGFEFRTLRPGGAAEITDSQSARAVVWLAQVLDDPQMTPQDRTQPDREHLLASVRFLQQLVLRPESTWTVPNAARAVGGLRNAAWDSQMPVAAQAMALLAAVKAIHAVDSLGKGAGN